MTAARKVFNAPELLSLIFIQCLSRDGFAKQRLGKAPVKFTLVCKYWRETALSTPELWSSLRLRVPSCRLDVSLKRLWALLKWLSLSKDRPFSFHLTYPGRTVYGPGYEESIASIADVLFKHANRWHTVIAIIPHCSKILSGLDKSRCLTFVDIKFRSFYPPLQAEQSKLHKLDFSCKQSLKKFRFSGVLGSYSATDNITWINIPPSLEQLALRDCNLNMNGSPNIRSALSAVRFTHAAAPWQTLYMISKLAPNLKLLELNDFVDYVENKLKPGTEDWPVGPPEAVHFLNLRKLIINDSGYHQLLITGFLVRLRTPSLVSISAALVVHPINGPHFLTQFKELIQCECGTVKNLRLEIDGEEALFALNILSYVPNVERLVYISEHSNLLLSALSTPTISGNLAARNNGCFHAVPFCPRLRILEVGSATTLAKDILKLVAYRNTSYGYNESFNFTESGSGSDGSTVPTAALKYVACTIPSSQLDPHGARYVSSRHELIINSVLNEDGSLAHIELTSKR